MQLQVRYDLEYFPVEGYRDHSWVVRDPLTRQCYHLGEEEYFLLTKLHGVSSLETLRQQFEQQFFPRLLTIQELKALVTDWLLKHLVTGDPTVVARWKREAGIVEEERDSLWKSWLKNPLVLRFRGWDPQHVLEEIAPWFRWVYTIPVLCFLLIFYALGAGIAVQNFPEILLESSQLPRLSGLEFWLVVVFWISLTKIFHELGHALTCHQFGGRCHEMGVMILAGIPCLYCNVTDAWTFRRRRERVLVSLAGIAVDLLVASCAILLWSVSSPGLFHAVCLLLALLCSLNSLFLNGNPLMRYDGYYILSDLTGKANLRSESQKQARSLIWRGLMGKRQTRPEQPVSIMQVIYGAAAGVYLWVVVGLILTAAYQWFKTWGGENLVVFAGACLVLSLVTGISRRWVREGKKEYLVRGKRKSRLNWGLGVCLALCLLLMFIPFPRRVPVMAGVLQVDGLEPVVCLEEGILKEIFLENETIQNGLFQNRPFQNGTVAPGQSLFLLENPELKQQMVELENGRLLLNSREQAIQRKRTQLVDSAESIALLAEQKKNGEDQLQRLVQRESDLKFVAKTSGRFYPAPLKLSSSSEQIQNQFEVRRLARENLGRLVSQGEVLGEISHQKSYRVLVAVEEYWAEKLSPGERAILFLPESGGVAYRGRLTGLSPAAVRPGEQETASHSAAQQVLSRLLLEKPGQEQMSVVTGWVEVEDPGEVDWSLYQTCQVRIETDRASLAQRLREFFQRNWKK